MIPSTRGARPGAFGFTGVQRHIRRRSAALAILGSFAVAGLSGCGGGGGTVNVALQEWAVVPAVASVEHGKVTFAATNKGPEDAHELVVFKTDLGVRDLPANADGKVDEEGAGLTMIGEIEEFDPGKTGSATFDLTPGRYVLVCNIVSDEPDGTKESHYRLGMSTEFTVK
jgi:uncharacterized cupredoxin-like copper-binding protein